jgi:hypothetical protein
MVRGVTALDRTIVFQLVQQFAGMRAQVERCELRDGASTDSSLTHFVLSKQARSAFHESGMIL